MHKKNTKRPKRGLVLEGGGAKGGYALGCLFALRDLGITFDAVAGTSVGALNAVIVACDKLSYAKSFWESISFFKICETTYSKYILWGLLPLHLIGLLVTSSGATPFSAKVSPEYGIRRIVYSMVLPVSILLIVLIIISLIIGSFNPIDIVQSFWWYLIIVLLLTLSYLFRLFGYSVLTLEPLRSIIDKDISFLEPKIPTYVTLTRRQMAFDPDMPGFHYMGEHIFSSKTAIEQEIDIPYYVRYDMLNKEDRLEVLTASIAIPYGVSPSVKIDNIEYVDGGLADNCPIFPIVNIEKCDELYIIKLRPIASKTNLRKAWQKIDRTLRLAKLDIEECRELYKSKRTVWGLIWKTFEEEIIPPRNLPYRNPEFWPNKIYTIAPKEKLGNFISGTMNFNSRYSKKLIELGYSNTMEVIRQDSENASRE